MNQGLFRAARRLLVCALWFALAYCIVAYTVFAFRNPQLTDTQRLILFREAMTWKTM